MLITAEQVNIISYTYSIPYSILNKRIPKLEDIKRVQSKSVLFVDLTTLLSSMSKMIDFEKDNEESLSEREKKNIAVAVLNIVGHYRHFFYSQLEEMNTIILFASDLDTYDNYKGIINILDHLILFYPKILFIPQLGNNGKYTNVHIICNLMTDMRLKSNKYNRTIRFFILSKERLLFQAFGVDSDLIFLQQKKQGKLENQIVMDRTDVWKKYLLKSDKIDVLLNDKSISREMDRIIPQYIALFGDGKHFKVIDPKLSRLRIKKKIQLISDYVTTRVENQPINNQLIGVLPVEIDRKDFTNRLILIHYKTSPVMEVLNSLYKSWGIVLRSTDLDAKHEYVSLDIKLESERLLQYN